MRIVSDDINWNAPEDEYLGESNNDDIDNSMRFDPLDMAVVSFCWLGILGSVRKDFYKWFLVRNSKTRFISILIIVTEDLLFLLCL